MATDYKLQLHHATLGWYDLSTYHGLGLEPDCYATPEDAQADLARLAPERRLRARVVPFETLADWSLTENK